MAYDTDADTSDYADTSDDADTSEDTDTGDDPGQSTARVGSTGTLTEIFVGLIWLGANLWTAHAALTGDTDSVSGALGSAAAALPGVVAATVLTGATIGHAASSRFTTAARRLLAGLAVGTLFGLAAAAGIRLAYGSGSSIMVLAMIVGAASVVGGAAAILPDPVQEAGLWATTWVFFAGVIFGVWQSQLMTLLGGGETASAAAHAAAATRLTYAQSALTGLLAGIYAFRWMRGEGRTWLWYVAAGGLPGMLLLAAEGLTRLGGASLPDLTSGFGAGATSLIEVTGGARLRHAVIVLLIGAIVASIAAARQQRRDRDE